MTSAYDGAGSTTGLPRFTYTPGGRRVQPATRRFTFAVHRYAELSTGLGDRDETGQARMLTDEHHAVNTMIDQGAPFDHIEEYINTLALPEDQLAALWLLAWAEAADPGIRRRVVAETLGTRR